MTSPRSKRLGVVVLSAAVLLSNALTVGIVLLVRSIEAPLGIASLPHSQVDIVRAPGELDLAPLERTVRDSALVMALAEEIWNLPRMPLDERCPASFGTSVKASFAISGLPDWSATIGVQGCEVVEIKGHPLLWAAHSPELWTNLGIAPGLPVDEVQPLVCLGPAGGSSCARLDQSSVSNHA